MLAYDDSLRNAACSRAFAISYQVFIQIPVYDRYSIKVMWDAMRKYRGITARDHSPDIRVKNRAGACCTYLGMNFSLVAGKIFKWADGGLHKKRGRGEKKNG